MAHSIRIDGRDYIVGEANVVPLISEVAEARLNGGKVITLHSADDESVVVVFVGPHTDVAITTTREVLGDMFDG